MVLALIKVLTVLAVLGPVWSFGLYYIFGHKRVENKTLTSIFGYIGFLTSVLDGLLFLCCVFASNYQPSSMLVSWNFIFYGTGAWFWLVALLNGVVYLNYKTRGHGEPTASGMFGWLFGELLAFFVVVLIILVIGWVWNFGGGPL